MLMILNISSFEHTALACRLQKSNWVLYILYYCCLLEKQEVKYVYMGTYLGYEKVNSSKQPFSFP